MKRIALIGAAAGLAAGVAGLGCLQNPTMTAAVADYVPLTLGNVWCYYVVNTVFSTPSSWYERWAVLNEEGKDGKQAFKIQRKYADQACSPGSSAGDTHWVDRDGDLQWNVNYNDCKWVTVFKYPPIEGSDWTSSCTYSLGSANFTWKMRGRETAKVNISNTDYENCGKVQETDTFTIGSATYTYEWVRWFAPGIGLVKEEETDRTPGSSNFNQVIQKRELVSHSIQE